jgi:Ca2+/Na+ antiporter
LLNTEYQRRFTNAIEWFGKKLNLGQGVVGSVFAAVGTALPETIIPIIAILYYKGEKAKEIGIGAIAGAPFMLGTLAFFVTGLAVVIYTIMGKRSLKMNADVSVFSRDLTFFLVIYGIAVLTTVIHHLLVLKAIIAILLLLSYILYLKRSFSDECEQCEDLEPLYFTKVFKVKTGLTWIVIQLLIALAGIVFGAHTFVKYVEDMSNLLGIAPLILSIIITPIATELPEKLNSVIWTGRKKDTLALGNITGAMVFQSCFPVVFGMLFTSWDLTGITLVSAVIAIVAAALNLAWIKIKKTVNPFVLLFGGILYSVFLFYIFA